MCKPDPKAVAAILKCLKMPAQYFLLPFFSRHLRNEIEYGKGDHL